MPRNAEGQQEAQSQPGQTSMIVWSSLLTHRNTQDDNKRLSETETRMREELHERLEGMVLDVQELIEQKENPESIPVNVESDEL